MAKTISMTAEEINKNYDVQKAIAMAKAAPEEKELSVNPGAIVARGLPKLKEYINKKEQLKSKNSKIDISIKIPSSYATALRSTGRGWQTRAGEYLVNGIKRGDFGKISVK